jgi:phosphopantetheine adenylyltransferase
MKRNNKKQQITPWDERTATVIAFIAQYPFKEKHEEIINSLTGDAKVLAEYLVDESKDERKEIRSAANHLRETIRQNILMRSLTKKQRKEFWDYE